MFIVYMYFHRSREKDLCVVTKSREEAKRYIEKRMEGNRYNGLGLYKVDEIELYEVDIDEPNVIYVQ